MSLGSLGPIGGQLGLPSGLSGALAAGTAAQSKGAEVDRVRQTSDERERQADSEELAEKAAGVEHMDEEQAAGERDADGRRLWERSPTGKKRPAPDDSNASARDETPRSRDASGQAGNQLDLSG